MQEGAALPPPPPRWRPRQPLLLPQTAQPIAPPCEPWLSRATAARLRVGGLLLLSVAATCIVSSLILSALGAEHVHVCVVAEQDTSLLRTLDSVTVRSGLAVRWWIVSNRTQQLDATLRTTRPRLDYRLIPLDEARAQLRTRPRPHRSQHALLDAHDVAELPAFHDLDRLIVLGANDSFEMDVEQLWKQRPQSSGTLMLRPCMQALGHVPMRSGPAADVDGDDDDDLSRGPSVLFLHRWRARRKLSSSSQEWQAEAGMHMERSAECLPGLQKPIVTSADRFSVVSLAREAIGHMFSSAPFDLGTGRQPGSTPPPSYATPVERHPELAASTAELSDASAGLRSRLAPGARKLLRAQEEDEEGVTALAAIEDVVGSPNRAHTARQSPTYRQAELLHAPTGIVLPPPLPSLTVLPPTLPPLPLPLNVLRQRLEAQTNARSPSLPPPLQLGKQCSPDHEAECGCSGGTCECDLYPDYSQHSSGLSATMSRRRADDGAADDEREVVPPVRALQFFNSNFGVSPPSTPRRSKRGRALQDHRDAPPLRVLCYCQCPATDVLG